MSSASGLACSSAARVAAGEVVRCGRRRGSGRPCWRRRSASRRGRTAARSQRARDRGQPRRELGRRVVQLRQRRGSPTTTRTRAGASRRSSRSRARAPSGSACAARNHSCLLPVWFRVRSPITRIPRACAARVSDDERLVAAEQRVDPVERVGVVAVRGSRREERRQVDDVRAQALDVVEVLLDAAQVSAEELERRVRAAALRQRVPARARTAQSGASTLEAARREPVGEDLVDDRLEVPVGPAGGRARGRSRRRPGPRGRPARGRSPRS